MQIILDGRATIEHAVLALGMFDGVHIGHRVLLKKAKTIALRSGVPLVACTFVRHPMQLIAPEKCPPMLSTFEERVELLTEMGVDMLFTMPFDEHMMDELPECYIGELVRRFHPTHVVCGYNHSYGKQGKGTPALLEVLGEALHFQTVVVPQITLNGAEVSSSVIRSLLQNGEVERARERLSRPYELQAEVVAVDGEYCQLMMFPKGKQNVAEGCYRVLWEQSGQACPMLVHVQHAGRAAGKLPKGTKVHTEGRLRFLVRREPPLAEEKAK